jgi:N-acyl-D-amino-acid deacylase
MKKNVSSPAIREKLREIARERYASRGSDFSWIRITRCDAYPEFAGKSLTEAAKLHGKDEYETAFDILRDCRTPPRAVYFSMCEEDVETVLAHPRAMICTDSGVAGKSASFHPRLVGAFPRALGRYVRERKVTTLPEMIRKMTSLPAHVYGLTGKGAIREGMDADLCIFDADRIIDRADYDHPTLRAEGLKAVLVGGEVAAENAVATGVRNGKLLVK